MIHGIVIRGTTPEHEFDLPYPKELVESLRVTYGQKGKVIFTKRWGDCKITDDKIIVSLSQEETFLFSAQHHIQIEIRLKLTDGKVVRTEEPIVLRVIDTMDDEVIE